jgi:hypothetical protein
MDNERMRTISHPEYPEQLYFQDEKAQERLRVERESKPLLVGAVMAAFTTPKIDCTKCGKRMSKKWINQWGGAGEGLFLVCEECHLFVDCEVRSD